MRPIIGLAFGVLTLGATGQALAQGVLGLNLVGGGDFEDHGTTTFTGAFGEVTDYKYYKREHSPRLLEEGDYAPVRAWQFHPSFDWGRWMTVWGTPGGEFDTQKGIGTFDDPRSYWSATTHTWSQPVNNINVSADPLDPTSHVLEGVFFRSWAGQLIKAPANQIAGPARFDLDYFLKYWIPQGMPDAPVIMHAYVYGVPDSSVPTWEERWGPGTQASAGYGPDGSTRLYATPHFSNWGGDPFYTSDGFVDIRDGSQFTQGQWYTLSDGVTAPIPGSGGQSRTTDGSFEITQVFPYYYVEVWLVTYSEDQMYYPLGGPADEFAVGVDNVSLRVTVPLGDVNRDRAVNGLDIASFVWSVNTRTYRVEADCNRDGAVNALDIASFIRLMLPAGNAQPAPEPSTVAFLALALAVACGRRGRLF